MIAGQPLSREFMNISDFKGDARGFAYLSGALKLGVPLVLPQGISIVKGSDGSFDVNIPEVLKSGTVDMPEYKLATPDDVARLFKELNDFFRAFKDKSSSRTHLVGEDILDALKISGENSDQEVEKFIKESGATHRFKIELYDDNGSSLKKQLENPITLNIALAILELTSADGFRAAIGSKGSKDTFIQADGNVQTHIGDYYRNGSIGYNYIRSDFTTHSAVKVK